MQLYNNVKNKVMQADKKQIVLDTLAKTTKRLRGNKSQYMLGAEYDIPSSVISDIERGVKDPQFTTLLKLSFALNIPISKFMKEYEKDLPDNFLYGDV